MPKVTLEFFLKYESSGAPIRWEATDCGQQSGDASADRDDRDRDIPTCVEADFDANRRAVNLMVAVGSMKKGLSKTPALFSATVTDIDGQLHSLRRLSDLPKELNRPLPRTPRDLPSRERKASLHPAGVNQRFRATSHRLHASYGLEVFVIAGN